MTDFDTGDSPPIHPHQYIEYSKPTSFIKCPCSTHPLTDESSIIQKSNTHHIQIREYKSTSAGVPQTQDHISTNGHYPAPHTHWAHNQPISNQKQSRLPRPLSPYSPVMKCGGLEIVVSWACSARWLPRESYEDSGACSLRLLRSSFLCC